MRVIAALALLVVGSALDVPIAIVLGVVALLLEVVNALWARLGLRGRPLLRRLGGRRTPWAREMPMTVEVWNRAGCRSPGCGRTTRRRPASPCASGSWWTAPSPAPRCCATPGPLRPWGGCLRRFHVGCDPARGVHARPRSTSRWATVCRRVASSSAGRRHFPRLAPDGARDGDRAAGRAGATSIRARTGLAEDRRGSPASARTPRAIRCARIHARTSARRMGGPGDQAVRALAGAVRFLIALDVQTIDGPPGSGFGSDEVESLVRRGGLGRAVPG